MLEDQSAGRALRISLSIFIFVIVLVVTIILHDRIWDIVSSRCPSDTFASGKVHFFWDGLADAAFCAFTFFSLRNLVGFWLFTTKDRETINWDWGVKVTIVALFMSITTGAALWFTIFTPVCLAESGIYHRTAPWSGFQRHFWTDVTRVDVDCRSRGKSPDLYYVLTMKDDTKLDVGDALNGRTFDRFRARLENVPLNFTAKIHRSCPDWFSDWAGKKP